MLPGFKRRGAWRVGIEELAYDSKGQLDCKGRSPAFIKFAACFPAVPQGNKALQERAHQCPRHSAEGTTYSLRVDACT